MIGGEVTAGGECAAGGECRGWWPRGRRREGYAGGECVRVAFRFAVGFALLSVAVHALPVSVGAYCEVAERVDDDGSGEPVYAGVGR